MKNELETTLQNAQNAFINWKKTSITDRQILLTKLSKHLLTRKEDYAKIITREMHKPIAQSIAEIEKCANMCEFYANAKDILQIERVETEYSISEIYHEPMGVILGIMPWNYPFWQVLRFAIPTILAGNTVIIKHASICMETGNTLQSIFLECGFPAYILTHVIATHNDIEELLSHPIIKAVSLTGSENTGRKIAEISGKNLKKCVLELGGSDAFIVLDDADLNLAAKDAASSRLQNCGQTCVAGKRFVIHEKIYDEFISKLSSEYEMYIPSDPENHETVISCMSREDLATELENQYKKAIDYGAKPIIPLVRISELAFKPGLILIDNENPITSEELFGPLGMVFKVKDNQEALSIANKTMFGLANSIYTSSRESAMHFASELESGSVAINQNFRSDWRLPFGGRKNSGYGVELSLYALKEFTIMKSIIGSI